MIDAVDLEKEGMVDKRTRFFADYWQFLEHKRYTVAVKATKYNL